MDNTFNKEIIKRLIAYCTKNKLNAQLIDGIDQNAKDEKIIKLKGLADLVSIDEIELVAEGEMSNFIQNKIMKNNANSLTIEQSATPNNTTAAPQIKNSVSNLADLKDGLEARNVGLINNLIAPFSTNEAGSIDPETGLKNFIENTQNVALDCISKREAFSKELTDYNVDGSYKGSLLRQSSIEEDIISNSFDNIKIFLDVTKLYAKNYDVDKIKEVYIAQIQDKMRLQANNNELNNQQTNKETIIQPDTQVSVNPNLIDTNENTKQKTLTPPQAKAGFADIFVLTLIVVVYAVIIINLVMKIS